MIQGKQYDPIRGFKFRVRIDGIEIGFAKVSGLKGTTEVTEYREGDDPVVPRKLPGMSNFENVNCEKGVSQDDYVVRWRKKVIDLGRGGGAKGTAEGSVSDDYRRTVVIEVYNKEGHKTRVYTLLRAWPASLEHGELDAKSSNVHIDSMVLAHEGMTCTSSGESLLETGVRAGVARFA